MFKILLTVIMFSFLRSATASMQVGFYSNTCPNAESIISSVVRQATREDHTTPARLLRLHYHDCFVQGCDGSILIDNSNGGAPEKSSRNHIGVSGYDVIHNAKTELEKQCEGIVSCADIVALTARDAIALSGGPLYQVPTGRRDGHVSNVTDADNMPDVHDSVETLREKFVGKGLSENDLVVLTGAHTIGTTACFFVTDRLYNFNQGGGSDPLMHPALVHELKERCPNGGLNSVRVPLDRGSERSFDTNILRNIQTGFGTIHSDAILYTDSFMRAAIDSYVHSRQNFGSDFVDAIIRMGQIGIWTGDDGEIGRVCSEFN